MRKAFAFLGITVFGVSLIAISSDFVLAQRGPGGGGASVSEVEKPPVPRDENEKKILAILDDIDENQRFRNVPKEDGGMLRLMTEAMKAKHVVEIGTSTGISGIWFGMALQKTKGKLMTYEIDEERAKSGNHNQNGNEFLVQKTLI